MLMVHRHAKMKKQEDGMHSLKMERRVHDAMQEDAGNKGRITRRRASQVLIGMIEHCVTEHKIKRKIGTSLGMGGAILALCEVYRLRRRGGAVQDGNATCVATAWRAD